MIENAPRWWRRLAADVLPPADITAVMQACVFEGDAVADAWQRWCSFRPTLRSSPGQGFLAVRELLGLLHWNLERHRIELPPEVRTHLRFARFTEQLRGSTYRTVCGKVFARFDAAGIPFVVLKGAALAETAYERASLRHSDDIDVWLRPEDLAQADDLLRADGWHRQAEPSIRSALHLPALVDASGVPVELHGALLAPGFTPPYEQMWDRTRETNVSGRAVRVLDPIDMLFHVCVHGVTGLPTRRWIPDALFLLRRTPAFDWDLLIDLAIGSGASVPISLTAMYLREQMQVAIPDAPYTRLQTAAWASTRRERIAARPWPSVDRGPERRSSGGVGWLLDAWRAAFPPPAQMALTYGLPPSRVPLAYAQRFIGRLRGSSSRPRRVGWRGR